MGRLPYTEINALAVFDDGGGPALYAAGEFSRAWDTWALAIAKWDGSWSALPESLGDYDPYISVYPAPQAMVVFDDGGGDALFVGGCFGTAGGLVVNGMAKWDGQAWSALGSGLGEANDYDQCPLFGEGPKTLAIFDDGTGPALYAGGRFESAGGSPASNIAKWNGSSWYSLGAGVSGTEYAAVYALASFDDGSGTRLFAGGYFESAGGVGASNIAQWDGNSWSPVSTGMDGSVTALAVFDDGSGPALYAGGGFSTAGGVATSYIAKWDGISWSAVGGGIIGECGVSELTVYDDGTGPALYAGGCFDQAGQVSAPRIAKWDGQSWSSVGGGIDPLPSGGDSIRAMTVFDRGAGPRLYVTGRFESAGGVIALGMAQWNGSVWAPLEGRQGSGLNDAVFDLAVDDAGTFPGLYAGGRFTRGGAVPLNRIGKWDGVSWSPLGTGMDQSVVGITFFDDGAGPALFAVGSFTTSGGIPADRVAKWNGSSWEALGEGLDAQGFAVAGVDGGPAYGLYAGGSFTTAGGVPANRIARWDGAAWYDVGGGMSSYVYTLTAFDDGTGWQLYAGGLFNMAGGVPANRVAKWDGTTWQPVGSGLPDTVQKLEVLDDGGGPALYAAWDGGVSRWTGVQWVEIGSTGNYTPYAMAYYDDGSGLALFAAGYFFQINQVTARYIAKWDGTSWLPLDGDLDDAVYDLAVFDDGGGPGLFAGGSFNRAGDTVSLSLAKWSPPCTEPPSGACCGGDGLPCVEKSDEAACTDAGGAWQGFGSNCDPDCCPAGSTGGDFCGDAVPYVLDVPSAAGEAFVHTITTNTADSVVGPGTGPIEGECEFTSCSETGYCDGDPAASCNVVAQDCAGETGPCIDRRCQVDGDCPAGESCHRKPCAHQKPMGHPLACAPGRCGSDSGAPCRTAGDCPLGITGDSCLDMETCERFDCGDPNVPSLGWRVVGSDPVRWEAFTLNECAEVTIDYCCTDDNPNHPEGIAMPQSKFFDICEPGETRPKYCEGLKEPDYPAGTRCDYCEGIPEHPDAAEAEKVQCTTDAECSAVPGATGLCVKGVDVCPEGTCSVGGEPCHDSNECPLGTCTGAAGLPCRRDGECPSGETCNGGSVCVGGQACERLRDFCGPLDERVVRPIYPDPDDIEGWPFGWYCGGGDWNWATVWELPPGDYYFPIRALQTCNSTGGNCNSDNDCPDGDVCGIYEHEYQIHITTRLCFQGACCRLGEICQGGDVNNPDDWCEDSSAGTCATSGDPCSVDDDCAPGICEGGSGDPCTADSDCTQPEMCQDDGFCGIRSGTACTSDADCTVTYTRGDNVTLTETCQSDGLCGYSCHRTYAKPTVMTPSDFCPTAPGAICVGFESCILTDCPRLVCSDDFSTCAGAGDCTQGTCQTWDGGGSMAPCHRDSDCPPGICPVAPFSYCRHNEECFLLVTCANPYPEVCIGGASCDPHQCVSDQPLCSITDRRACENNLQGFWQYGVEDCVPPGAPTGENVCFVGACCTDDIAGGLCKDDAAFDSIEECATWGGASLFVPGGDCAADPCPVCEIEDDANCQSFDVSTGFITRCDAQSGTSIPNWRCADDFVNANPGPLNRVCWWPAYAPVSGAPECSQPGERPPIDWNLRVYPDLGHIPDEGGELGPAGGQILNVDIAAPIVGRVWQNSSPVDDPIPLAANECYWIEISGAGNETCDIFWSTSNRGNDYAMQDFNFPDFGRYTSEDATNADFAWCVSTGIVSNGAAEAGCPDVLGACCACACGDDPPICVPTSLDECAKVVGCEFPGKWRIYRICETSGLKCQEDSDCDTTTNEQCIAPPSGDQCDIGPGARAINPCGGKPVNDECANLLSVSHVGNYCQGDPGATCDLFTNAECTGAGTPAACCTGVGIGTCVECAAGDGPCLPHDINDANNPPGSPNGSPCNDIRCATTDGPPTGCAIGGGDLTFDVWYEYAAPACGTVTIQNCNSLPIYDGFGAVYRKADFTPGSECADIIAGGASEAACNDDGCGVGGPWSYQLDVVEGEELIIRMGAWFDGDVASYFRSVDEGCFELHLDPIPCTCESCVFPPLTALFPHDRRKNRYISFDPNKGDGTPGSGNDGLTVAFKVELLSINMGSCDDGTGGNVDFCRIDRGADDCNVCSGSGASCILAQIDCPPGESCDPTGAVCVNDAPNSGGSNVGMVWWVGPEKDTATDPSLNIHLLVSEPFRKVSTDWPNPVHVADCEVVPQATYGVRAVETAAGAESDELVVETTQFPPLAPPVPFWWGDVVGVLAFRCNGDIREATCVDSADCGGDPCERAWELPNGVTNVDDVTAALWTSAPAPPTTVSADFTWVDLHGNGSFTDGSQNFDPPNNKINAADLQQIISGFGGFPYKFHDPADCPDTGAWP